MRQGNSTPLRVLHLVSSNGIAGSTQQMLFMPLLTKLPKQRVAAEVVCLAPDAVPAAVLRQIGIPVHTVPLCRQRFAFTAFAQLTAVAREFRPDVIHAWGYTAQFAAGWLRKRCGSPRVVMSASGTSPVTRGGFLERQKLKAAARAAAKADRLVFSSEAAAAAHRRISFPEQGHAVIAPGVDPSRFKPDPVLRKRIREQLSVPANAFVVGMMAPFQAEYDHATLMKGLGDLVKTQPNVYVLLAGHGVQKGNAPLMALLGSGNLATRTQLLGEWTDFAGFFNACDVAASSAQTDAGRMNLVMAMLCGVPCVATGVGEQGEVIGQCSVAIEPNSPAAVVRGMTRVLEMPAERRTFLAQSSRKHVLKNFTQLRSLQQYLQLYFEVLGRAEKAEDVLPTPAEVEAVVPTLSVAPAVRAAVAAIESVDSNVGAPAPFAKASRDFAAQRRSIENSLEDSVQPSSEARRSAPAAAASTVEEKTVSDVDVLEIFESAMMPRTDGVAAAPAAKHPAEIEVEDLLAPELLAANAGEEFRPKQVAPKARAASSESATVRAIRGSTAASTSARPGAVSSTSARPAPPSAAPASSDSSSDLEATLQLDVLTGALLDPPKE